MLFILAFNLIYNLYIVVHSYTYAIVITAILLRFKYKIIVASCINIILISMYWGNIVVIFNYIFTTHYVNSSCYIMTIL